MIGAVEGGGTKFLVAVGDGPDAIVERARFETRGAEETLREVVAFLGRFELDAIGLATFGPLDLRAGTMQRTPKAGWTHAAVRAPFEALGCPVILDTDVNAAALAEQRLGAARGADPVLYVTVGTGIGVGVVVHGKPVHGLVHPEMGHVLVAPLANDPFEGACPFHGRCLEGVASGTALRARLGGAGAETLPDNHQLFTLAGGYLGLALATAVLTLSPQRIVVGGSVAARPAVLPALRAALLDALGGYVPTLDAGAIDSYVVPPAFPDSGLRGGFLLAER